MQKTLQNIFGFKEFRSGQKEIIESILNGNNVLAVLPTGAGKSLCYQIPALMGETFSIVISPLIALMKDQVDGLNTKKEVSAYINSTLTYQESEKVLRDIERKKIKLLYVSPERLENLEFTEKIKILKPKYIFVDEAHCISEWGHNFRPSYRKIIQFCEAIGNQNISAFTATAIPEVQRDVVEHFHFNNPRIFIRGFERDNLQLNVIKTKRKKETTLRLIKRSDLPVIAYTSTRKNAEELSNFLNLNGLSANYYHAGLNSEQRRMIQDDFMQDRLKIICATNAFGMGVDKPDIRLLIHYNLPASIENYYQEIGRAGRDGKNSKIYLLYEEKDYHIQEYFINNSYPTEEEVKQIYVSLCDYTNIAVGSRYENFIPIDKGIEALLQRYNISKQKMIAALRILQDNDLIQFNSGNNKNSYIRVLFKSNELKIFIEKYARNLSRDFLLFLLRNYGENVFQNKIKIDITTLSRKLDSLQENVEEIIQKLSISGVIDYEKPLEVMSIKLLNERVYKDSLRIDVKKWLDHKKSAEHKLQKMKEYLFSDICRFKYILNYFGEEKQDYKCGQCDNCLNENSTDSAQIEYIEEIIINSIHEASGTIKINDFIKMLLGTAKHPGLKQFSNFGVCKHFNSQELKAIIDNLADKDVIQKFDNRLTLSEKGKDFFTIVSDDSTIKPAANSNYEANLELFNQLRQVRKTAAKKFSQSTQLICSDSILRKIVEVKPNSPSKLMSVEGFNQWMFNKIGEDFLETIYEFTRKSTLQENIKEKKIPENIKTVYDLMNKKYSLEDIASLTKLPEAVVSMQLETIIEYFPETDISSLIKKHEIELIKKEISKGITDLKEIK
ncbi:MAG: RecQ family ATP-dependent DNA helicase, partial [Bacteroidota bacterium]